jgi:hypothetical protein
MTIEIPEDVAVTAQAHGLTAESYVQSLIDDEVRRIRLPLPPVEPKISMDEFIQEMSAHSDKVPQLPDEAFPQESFYKEHD